MGTDTIARIALDHEPNLRACVKRDPEQWSRFEEAFALWQSLYVTDRETFERVPALASRYEEAHFERVEGNLNKIIYAPTLDEKSYIPNTEEALILLTASWLHDVGMLNRIFDDDHPLTPQIAQEITDTYHERTARYIRVHWEAWCNWSEFQKNVLGETCLSQRPGSPISELDTDFGGVNLRKIAALLRIAGACHLTGDHYSVELQKMLQLGGSFEGFHTPCKVARWIQTVEFDHATNSIAVLSVAPRPKDIPPDSTSYLPAVRVDYRPALVFLCDGLQAILDEVSWYTSECSNTRFGSVKLTIKEWDALGDAESYVQELWLSLLACASCAGEVASMLATIIRGILKSATDFPTQEIRDVISYALSLHPYNFLVHQLATFLSALAGQEKAGLREKVVRELDIYLENRQRACHAVAEQTKRLIGSDDVIAVYGYSKIVVTLLTKTLESFRGRVFVVPVKRGVRGPLIKYEDDRICDALLKASVEHELVELTDLPSRIRAYIATGRNAKVLLGTRGVFDNEDILATVGNQAVALAAKDAGAEVIALAELSKATVNPKVQEELRQRIQKRDRDSVVASDQHVALPGHTLFDRIDVLSHGRHYDRLVIGDVPDCPNQTNEDLAS